jgi:hypothetical protein
MATKTHFAAKGTVADRNAFRSLCGRSSGRVIRIDTIEQHQNIGTEQEVTCSFCLRILAAKAKLEARP